MSSILPEGSDSKTSPPPSLRGVAQMMVHSADPFTREVGGLLETIGFLHEYPAACDECRESADQCVEAAAAHSIAFAWLLKVVEERG